MPITKRVKEMGASLSEMLHKTNDPIMKQRAEWFINHLQSITNTYSLTWLNASSGDSFSLEHKGEVQEAAENLTIELTKKFGLRFKPGSTSGYTPYMMVSARKKIDSQIPYFVVAHSRGDVLNLTIRF